MLAGEMFCSTQWDRQAFVSRAQWRLQRGAGNKYKEMGRDYSNQENAEQLESKMGEKNLPP